MAEQRQPNPTTTNQSTNQPDPTPHRTLTRMAAQVQHLSRECLHLLARPETAGSLLFTCICVAIAWKSRQRSGNQPRRTVPLLHRSMSVAALLGGQLALQRIIDAQEVRLDEAMLKQAEGDFRRLLHPSDGRIRYDQLQSAAGKLEMTGKEDEAVAMLREEMKAATGQEAHELGMLLVEMLIYKGDYDEALRCPCLHEEQITDGRGPLYKAVIYTLKGDYRAEENYKNFQEIRSQLHPDAFKETPLHYDVVHDFSKFQTIVQNLKKEIETARMSKKR